MPSSPRGTRLSPFGNPSHTLDDSEDETFTDDYQKRSFGRSDSRKSGATSTYSTESYPLHELPYRPRHKMSTSNPHSQAQQSEPGSSGFRSRTTRSRFGRLSTHGPTDDEEHQGLLESSGHLEPGRAHDDDDDPDEIRKGPTTYTSSSTAGRSRSLFTSGSQNKGNDKSRTISFGDPEKVKSRYPANVVRNQKYNVVTFLP